MSKLLESILNENYISANELFEEKLSEIQEKKLIEMKKYIQAEAIGGLTKADIEARRKAGYVRASEVLPDPRDIVIGGIKPKSQKTEPKRKKKLEEDKPIPDAALRAIEARKVRKRKSSEQDQAAPEPEKETKTFKHAASKGLKRTLGRVKIGVNSAIGAAFNAKRAAAIGSRLAQQGVRSLKKSAKDTALKAVSDPLAAAGQAASAVGKGVETAAKGAASTSKNVYKNARTSGTKTNTALRYIAGALRSVEEESKPRRKIILRKKSRSNTLRIIKDKYKTKATNVAIEE